MDLCLCLNPQVDDVPTSFNAFQAEDACKLGSCGALKTPRFSIFYISSYDSQGTTLLTKAFG